MQPFRNPNPPYRYISLLSVQGYFSNWSTIIAVKCKCHHRESYRPTPMDVLSNVERCCGCCTCCHLANSNEAVRSTTTTFSLHASEHQQHRLARWGCADRDFNCSSTFSHSISSISSCNVLFYAYMPMLFCDCQSFIKESYVLTYLLTYRVLE